MVSFPKIKVKLLMVTMIIRVQLKLQRCSCDLCKDTSKVNNIIIVDDLGVEVTLR